MSPAQACCFPYLSPDSPSTGYKPPGAEEPPRKLLLEMVMLSAGAMGTVGLGAGKEVSPMQLGLEGSQCVREGS